MPQMLAEAPSFEIYEADWYETLVKEVEIQQRPADKYHDEPYVQLAFKSMLKVASDTDPTGTELKQFTFWCEPKSGNSKFNKVRVAMGLPPVERNEPFATEEMEGRYLRLSLDDKKADGTPGNRVLAYASVKRAKAKAPPITEQADEDEEVPF